MKPRVLVTREVFTEQLELLARHFAVESNQADEVLAPAKLAALLASCDGAMISIADRVDANLLASAPRLKAVCNIAVGYNNIDVGACTARRVMIANTPGVLDDATADFAFALMLAAARRVTELESYLRAGEWKGWKLKQWPGRDVYGATLGIIGMGRIGQAVARRARGFEMTVLYHNRKRLSPELEAQCNASYATLDDLLARADVVSLHMPYSPDTHHMIGARELARMKPTSILVNTARGGVVDDAALIDALKGGRLGGAGLDVFEGEPALNPEFLNLRNVVLTPHVASSTTATRFKMAQTAAENLVAALTAGKPVHWVNPW